MGVEPTTFRFVGVMTYSQYPYVEAFIDEKQRAGSQLMYICMSTSAVLPVSWFRIIPRQL